MSQIFYACKNGNINKVKDLVSLDGVDINIKNNENWTPLHFASRYDQLEIVKYLVEKGAHIETKTSAGYTPLHLAAHHRYVQIVKYLIESGADIETEQHNGFTVLHTATFQSDNLEIIKYLVKKGANIESIGNGMTPLQCAACSGDLKTLKYLMAQGANIEAVCNNGWSSMHYAAFNGCLEILKYLIEGKGFTIDNNIPLYQIANQGHLDTLKYLIEKGAFFNLDILLLYPTELIPSIHKQMKNEDEWASVISFILNERKEQQKVQQWCQQILEECEVPENYKFIVLSLAGI